MPKRRSAKRKRGPGFGGGAIPLVSSSGGGGLPARTTLPSLRNSQYGGYASGSTFALGTTNATGNLSIAMLNHFSQVTPAETLTVTNMDTVAEQIDAVLGVSGWTAVSRIAWKISPSNAQAGGFSGVTLGANAALFVLSAVFNTGTVDGDPIVILHELFDENQEGEMRCTVGVAPLRITFPTYEVPEGYTFLYGVITEDNLQGSYTWEVAQNLTGGSSTAGDDSNLTIARIDGPSDGADAVVEFVGYAGFAQGGAAAFIVAVPGT